MAGRFRRTPELLDSRCPGLEESDAQAGCRTKNHQSADLLAVVLLQVPGRGCGGNAAADQRAQSRLFAGRADGDGFGGDGGPPSQALFSNISVLQMDSQNNLYVGDGSNYRIRRIDGATGLVRTVAGTGTFGTSGDGGPATSAQLFTTSFALDPTGTKIYATSGTTLRMIDLVANTINRFAGTVDGRGPFQNAVPAIDANLSFIVGPWVNQVGEVFLADINNNQIVKISTSGIATTFAGGVRFRGEGGPSQNIVFRQPWGVLAESDGSILVGTNTDARLIRISKQGLATTVAGGILGFNESGNGGLAVGTSTRPVLLSQDSAGNIYLKENNYRENYPSTIKGFRRINTSGIIERFGPTTLAATGVQGMVIDPSGRYLYFSETTFNHVIRHDSQTNANVTIAGQGSFGTAGATGSTGDGGPATAARLASPSGLALDSAGNLYIADQGNNRIRKVDSTGVITAVAGNGQIGYGGDGGVATQASVPSPSGVAVNPQGDLFIVTTNQAVLRLEKSTGRLHRIAGGTTGGVSSLGTKGLDARFGSLQDIAVASNGEVLISDTVGRRVVALVPDSLATATITGVIQLSSFGAGETISSGGWVEIYGFKFATATTQWGGADFNGNAGPTTLAGVQVLFNGIPGTVQLVSPTQINAIPKDGILAGNTIIEVKNAAGVSNSVAMVSAIRSPGLLAPPSFTNAAGKLFAVAIHLDGAFAGPPNLIAGANFRRAKTGDRLTLFGIGFGPVTPPVAAGSIATTTAPLPNVRVKIGGKDAVVEYAGLAPPYVGLYQFNVIVPSGVTLDGPLEVTVDGVPVAQSLVVGVE
jgi:uncharacterized protein (TIGR03437 family)